MSLNDISLSSPLIRSLYGNILVSNNTEKPVHVPPGEQDKIAVLGNNGKSVTVIVRTADHAYLSDAEMELLTKILAACHLNLADVAIINAHGNPTVNYRNITNQLAPKYILFFGLEPDEIDFPIKFPFYKPQKYNNQLYVVAAPLAAMLNNTDEKTKLWNALKQAFLNK